MRSATRITVLGLWVALGLGCRDENPAFVARAFVASSFVTPRVEDALPLTVGAARTKLQAGAPLNGQSEALGYRETARHFDDSGVRFDFALSERAQPAKVRQHVSIFVRRIEGTWKVVDYEMQQEPGPPS